MRQLVHATCNALAGKRNGTHLVAALAAMICSSLLHGCASLSNPVANGVPVRRLPRELLGESKQNLEALPLSLLRQKPPVAYRLAAGDILGIWIEGVLGERGQAPPLHLSESAHLKPALGFPIPVRGDGKIKLPLVDAIKVDGMSLEEAQDAIHKAYVIDKKILQPGRERIIVTLQRPRSFHILVIRQDGPSGQEEGGGSSGKGGRTAGFSINIGGSGGRYTRKGMGFSIDLPAYENDVLNALARTGGFPGSEAENEIIIERGGFRDGQDRDDKLNDLKGRGWDPKAEGLKRIRIPLRIKKGEKPKFRSEDVILRTGDIVYIEAREADVFYTAGLLPPGEYILPRDADLDVLEAITRIGGILNSGGVSAINLNGTTLGSGLGFSSPSLCTVLRRTPEGGQIAIRVDLNRALRDPRERITIQPKDLIMLQERPEEAIARFFTQTFKLVSVYELLDTSKAKSAATQNFP